MRDNDAQFYRNNVSIVLATANPGSLVMPSGVGVLSGSEQSEDAHRFIEFLLSEPAQTYFATIIKEYPVSAGVDPEGDLPPMESLNPPDVDLGSISDLEGTLRLLRDVGVIP